MEENATLQEMGLPVYGFDSDARIAIKKAILRNVNRRAVVAELGERRRSGQLPYAT